MKRTLTILLALLLNLTMFATGDEWELEKDKDSIKIWTRETEGSNIKSFKAITTINATVAQLSAVLNDIESYPQWMADVETTKILEEIGEYERYYYFEVDAPWPVSNRDNIVHFLLQKDLETNEAIITVTGHPDYIPEKKGVVRIPVSLGTWKFIPIGENECQIIFEYTAETGGNLPTWVVNLFIVEGPFETLGNLKEFVKKDKYQ
jgi:ribosome-associated toxin RatA of RatAB toxin-antitoxin module